MTNQSADRPAYRWTLKGVLDQVMREVFRHLAKVALGPFRFLYSDAYTALYLQVRSRDTGKFSSVLKVDHDGNVTATGTLTGSTTIENPGRE